MSLRSLAAFLLCLFLPLCALAQTAPASGAFDTKAKQAFLVDSRTGTILFSRREDEAVTAASLAKAMTLAVVFKALRAGEISLDTTYPVSEYAWRTGGAPSRTATMFAALKSQVRVEDLIRGVAVQAANDACIILAEGMSGSEGAFAARMNEEARALGLTNSHFANATGLPDPGNRVSMRDLVTLARHLQQTYPEFYRYYAEPEFEWNRIKQRNRNPLVAMNIGADGLVMGFAEDAGYGLVASVERDGRGLLLAMSGLSSDKERLEEARRIIDWGMTAFATKTLFKAGETVAEASVYGGSGGGVILVTPQDVDVLLPVDNSERLSARVVYSWPLRAPVAPGQQVGALRIWNGDRFLREVPLQTAGTVEVGTLTRRARDALQELLFFWL
ncbi:D-alanyl-D-alanine carboxypeptidase family protein [Mycoplana rhizolycopersici]|uniref:serine-type D-Ala-D-Ala carboxypeptidase n=1 Tax=Mycoplana rhizolycopersici TaxID=2746702 RepID=A0ABX2QFL4_9HYPH|nr:D-alanyl-D-alanine carboxypeptidase family protein [Rhizobium rhizolycopersici]NVP55993.1 D-alanyl-D-alanine carboxypeptidase [Rhizobium rhizolycopersici]